MSSTFSVWAPKAETLDLRIAGADHAMSKSESGWWHADVPDAGPGADYAYIVNGDSPVPDPRSPWQPYGVHGPSRTVDHAAFPWTDPTWQPAPLSAAIVYELHIGTFTQEGTFESAIGRLDYLKDLGITHVELMPVNEFSGDWGWGYDGVDLYAPHHVYGGPDDLKRLVDACHAKGLAVLLDVVYNHLGPAGNYLSRFGPYFTDRYCTPWGEAINLDGPDSLEVRRFFFDNALMWLRDYHFDGLRLDAVHALLDTSALHFLEELAAQVRRLESALGRRKVLIAESDLNDPRLVRSPESGGYGLDAQWSDDLHHALHAVLTGETIGYYEDFGEMQQISKALTNTFVYDGVYSRHRRRVHGRPPENVSSHRFLGYLQTHDQVGNRARGERIAQLTSWGRAKIGAALYLLSPFIPMLFQGEEFGASTPFQYFTHHEEESLAKAVSEGRKREFAAFGWKPEDVPDPQDPETFRRSKLNWPELGCEPHREMLTWYKSLLHLRQTIPELASELSHAAPATSMEVEVDRYSVHLTRGAVHVICNLSSNISRLPVTDSFQILLVSDEGISIQNKCVVLPPESVVVGSASNQRIP